MTYLRKTPRVGNAIRTFSVLMRTVLLAACVYAPISLDAQSPTSAQLDSLRIQLDRAAAAMDTTALMQSETMLDRALSVYPTDARLMHYRGYAGYRHAIMAFAANKPGAAAPHLDRASKLLEKSAQTLAWPETFMLQASVAGMQIGLDPSRGMELGQLIAVFADRATQAGGKNARVLLLQAYAAQNTPPEYGGGVDKAKVLVQRAVDAFATDKPAQFEPAWGREEAAKLAAQLGVALKK